MDQLKRKLRNGAKRTMLSFNSHVGSGSDAHCLSGSCFTSASTSWGVTGVNIWNTQFDGLAVNVWLQLTGIYYAKKVAQYAQNAGVNGLIYRNTSKLFSQESTYYTTVPDIKVVFKILRLKCIGITILTFQWKVTSDPKSRMTQFVMQ